MINEQWVKVKDIFDAALQRTPDERAPFLAAACGSDETVRREVEGLLESFDRAGTFMTVPSVGETHDATMVRGPSLIRGQLLSQYEIGDLIGSGGAGEVYLARDTRLNRFVAVKVLSTLSPSDRKGNEGLWREAKAAAKLDHPNICAIHEIGEAAGCNFIVMQYVKGETLASHDFFDYMTRHTGILLAHARRPRHTRCSLDLAQQSAEAIPRGRRRLNWRRAAHGGIGPP